MGTAGAMALAERAFGISLAEGSAPLQSSSRDLYESIIHNQHADANEYYAASTIMPEDPFSVFEPVAYPVPLPGGGRGAEPRYNFVVQDNLTLPEGFSYEVIVRWGEILGPMDRPEQQINFGYNCDYTCLVPMKGSPNEFYLVVNHEYVSARPWAQSRKKSVDEPTEIQFGVRTEGSSEGYLQILSQRFESERINLADKLVQDKLGSSGMRSIRSLCDAILEDVGVSVVHVRIEGDGRLSVIKESGNHKRISAISLTNIKPKFVPRFSGPATTVLPAPSGTLANCSGCQTPWGTVLTCEENFQDVVGESITAKGEPLFDEGSYFGGENPHPELSLPQSWVGIAQGGSRSLDPRTFGWVSELNPETGQLIKHSALGRFRHENVALRIVPGKKLAAYMGDDRRGGHIWKYVSNSSVSSAEDPANTGLLEDGTLFVARFNPDFSGEWIPLLASTPLKVPEPEFHPTQHLMMPNLPEGGAIAVGSRACKLQHLSVSRWIRSIETYTGKAFAETTLGDLVAVPEGLAEAERANYKQLVLNLSAFLFGNAIGGTASARPEDIEVHPEDGSLYIAFTDATGRSEGSPDVRVFFDSMGQNSKQYGAIYHLVESGGEPSAKRFSWGRFVSSGEVAEGGGGFACADNLCFDKQSNIWMVCDISTDALNVPVIRDEKTKPGTKHFLGIFGNNSLFKIPTSGPYRGLPMCFAVAPMEAELTGPTFTPDGKSLILSVQHPGEWNGTRGYTRSELPNQREINLTIVNAKGEPFVQTRTVPVGSNFPASELGSPPLPAVVQIRQDSSKKRVDGTNDERASLPN